jgi:hypothetical protein
MTTSTHTHRSVAYVKAIYTRGRGWKLDPITDQFRFIVRMAFACHERKVPYNVAWSRALHAMRVTITAAGKIPTPKPLPKAPRLKQVSDWKPAIWDAVYSLEAYYDGNRKRWCPGFVIEHSCGLALVHPSESGELGVTEHGENVDIRQNWLLTHSGSGLRFGLTLSFKRATDALLLAASFAVDWTQPADALKCNPEFRRAGYSVQAAFGTAGDKDTAKRRLAELERAA